MGHIIYRTLLLFLYPLLFWICPFPSFAEASPEVIRITEEAGQNIKPVLTVDSEGKIWLAWQSNRGGDWCVYARYHDGVTWSPEALAVNCSGARDISFDIRTDWEGRAWIGWGITDFNNDYIVNVVGANCYWQGEWTSANIDTINAPPQAFSNPVGLFCHSGSLLMMIPSCPPVVSYDFATHTLQDLSEQIFVAFYAYSSSPSCFLSQLGSDKVWMVLDIESHFPTSSAIGLEPTAYFLSNGSWASFRLDYGVYTGSVGTAKLRKYVSVKSVGSDGKNNVYVTCAVDEDPITQIEYHVPYGEAVYYLNMHLLVRSFDASTGKSLSHWDLGDYEPSIMHVGRKDEIEVATSDEAEIIGFAISRNGNTILRALKESIWYGPLPLEEDSTITSAHPNAAVDPGANIWVAWDDGKDIYISWVNITDMEVDKLLTSVESDAADMAAKPAKFFLSPNCPNPFNASTSIVFQIPFDAVAELSVYDLLGQKVRALINTNLKRGEHRLVWDGKDDLGSDASSGIYFYRLSADGGKKTQTRKMVLLR